MSSDEVERSQIKDKPSRSQYNEPQAKVPRRALAEGDGPTTDALSGSLFNTTEPQPEVPRKSLAKEDVPLRIKEVRQRVQEKEEMLRKLKMAKTYRTKWETQDLGVLADQWLEVCQAALEDLQMKLKAGLSGDKEQQELTLKTLVDSLGIDPELVRLNEEDDCFFT